MDEKNENRDYVTARQLKWANFKAGVREKAQKVTKDVSDWCWAHPKEAMIGFGILASTGCTVAKAVSKTAAANAEIERRELDVWDPALGKWHHLKRAMTQRETMEYAQRRANGEPISSILADMRLLKW